MSNPLNERMRAIAQEVASGIADGLPGSERLDTLEQAIAALGARVEELEKAATAAPTAVKRTAVVRKGTSE